MSVKKCFAVELPDNDEVTPFIYRVADGEGMIWREAKKVIRKWYLDQASQLRSLSEAQFAANETKGQDAVVSDSSQPA